MTSEQAIKMAKADLKCMERDTSGQDEMCNSHRCDECSLNYERGNIGEQKEWLRMVIKALEQESKIGHWIDLDEKSAVCSCCYRNNTLYGDYCKWCGAKMVEPQEGSGEE